MLFWLKVIQLILAILLIASILLQNRGTGLSATFGGSGGVHMARRGVDRMLYWVTIFLAVAFFGISLSAVLI
jgi:preprotein translocase subunit SecG